MGKFGSICYTYNHLVSTMSAATIFLDEMNDAYVKLHHAYEQFFWLSYMGDRSVTAKKDKALSALDAFRANGALRQKAEELYVRSPKKIQERLQIWIDFFDLYQMPEEAKSIKVKIDALESRIADIRSTRSEGYVHPLTGVWVEASIVKMRTLIQTDPDEKIRKACFEAREKLALDCLDEYVELVQLRNQFAQLLGYADFYEYKLLRIDKMTKNELFTLFDTIADKTKGIFAEIRALEKSKKGLRKPWNFAYFTAGDFTKEEDQYFQFDQSLERWGRSFAALGINFRNGKLQLDLLDRKGKYNNGFCHWPDLVHFTQGRRQPGSANFTCLFVPGQVGAGTVAYNTLFHEGGHAAHMLNCDQRDVCLNHEYAPMTAAWAETHSMFIDTMFDSIEWKNRYAINASGERYSFELYTRKEEQLSLLKPKGILGIAAVSTFEREVYELSVPTAEKIQKIARQVYKKYNDFSVDSLWLLNVPHIYAWDSACAYHGYGLAEIALAQWREYFYTKYGYIVDNKNVGREMLKTWKWGAQLDFQTCIKIATGKKLSSAALIKDITLSASAEVARAKKRLARMEEVPRYKKAVDLQATISMVHGKKVIATNEQSFEQMAETYGAWVQKIAALNSKH